MQTEVLRGHTLQDWMQEEGWRPARDERRIRGTVVFRPGDGEAARRTAELGGRSLREVNQAFRPEPTPVVRLATYLESFGIRVSPPQAEGLYLDFTGTLGAVARAFRCTFAEKEEDGRQVYLNRDDPELPSWAAPHVLAVLGLENRSRGLPAHRYPTRAATPAHHGEGLWPSDIRTAYGFPLDWTGAGETIGVLEFSNGYAPADLEAFWARHGVPQREIAWVAVDGTANDGGVADVDVECTLDLEWAGALAPEAQLVVYAASAGADDRAFAVSLLKAVEAALADETRRPSVISISYGAAETHFPPQALFAWDLAFQRAAARGITVLVASGDRGAYGVRTASWPFPHCDAPASCPHVVAVGGTTLVVGPDGARMSEVGWSDTNGNGASGGGFSLVFGPPPWQHRVALPLNPAGQPGRGVPDVALAADPDAGYQIVFQGRPLVIGGTSAATPCWAAFVALANQARRAAGRAPLGLLGPHLYALGGTAAFYDIVEGNNAVDGVPGYNCGPGWDAVTGWGTINGSHLLEALRTV